MHRSLSEYLFFYKFFSHRGVLYMDSLGFEAPFRAGFPLVYENKDKLFLKRSLTTLKI